MADCVRTPSPLPYTVLPFTDVFSGLQLRDTARDALHAKARVDHAQFLVFLKTLIREHPGRKTYNFQNVPSVDIRGILQGLSDGDGCTYTRVFGGRFHSITVTNREKLVRMLDVLEAPAHETPDTHVKLTAITSFMAAVGKASLSGMPGAVVRVPPPPWKDWFMEYIRRYNFRRTRCIGDDAVEVVWGSNDDWDCYMETREAREMRFFP